MRQRTDSVGGTQSEGYGVPTQNTRDRRWEMFRQSFLILYTLVGVARRTVHVSFSLKLPIGPLSEPASKTQFLVERLSYSVLELCTMKMANRRTSNLGRATNAGRPVSQLGAGCIENRLVSLPGVKAWQLHDSRTVHWSVKPLAEVSRTPNTSFGQTPHNKAQGLRQQLR